METYFEVQDHVIVTNPTEESFTWRVGGEREYTIEAGQTKRLHGSAARGFVKKMTDLIIIRDNRVQELHSEEYRKEIAETLIVRVIKDDVEAEVEPKDLERAARENDSAPVKAKPAKKVEKPVEFPDLDEPKEAVKDAKPAKKPATKA